MQAAARNGTVAETRERIKALVAGEAPGGFVARVLGREVGPSLARDGDVSWYFKKSPTTCSV